MQMGDMIDFEPFSNLVQNTFHAIGGPPPEDQDMTFRVTIHHGNSPIHSKQFWPIPSLGSAHRGAVSIELDQARTVLTGIIQAGLAEFAAGHPTYLALAAVGNLIFSAGIGARRATNTPTRSGQFDD
jgi:hypothetical protein